jgi:hypothetical protein
MSWDSKILVDFVATTQAAAPVCSLRRGAKGSERAQAVALPTAKNDGVALVLSQKFSFRSRNSDLLAEKKGGAYCAAAVGEIQEISSRQSIIGGSGKLGGD